MIRFLRYFPVLFLVFLSLGAPASRAQPGGESQVLADWRQFRSAPNALYDHLVGRGIVVRNQTSKFGHGHLRINVGTPEENDRLLAALRAFAPA